MPCPLSLRVFGVFNNRERLGLFEAQSSVDVKDEQPIVRKQACLLYTSPSPRDLSTSRMPSSA